MTLDEWAALSPSERNCLRRDWPREGGPWLELLEEACTRFRAEYGRHALINAIDFSKGHMATYEPSIVVTTALSSPQLIEELPDRYLTFRVVQLQMEDTKQAYLRTWTLVLGQLLGWSEQRARAWAREHHEAGLDGKETWFYHEDEFYYILPLLIPEALREKLASRERTNLERRIKEAIVRHGSSPLWLSPYDWDAARNRINAILNEYDARLPQM